MCARPHPGPEGEVPATLCGGQTPRGASFPGRSQWVLSPQKASSFPKDTPALFHPAPYPRFISPFLSCLTVFLLLHKKRGLLPISPTCPALAGWRERDKVCLIKVLIAHFAMDRKLRWALSFISVTLDVKNLSWRTRGEKTLIVAERHAVEDFLKWHMFIRRMNKALALWWVVNRQVRSVRYRTQNPGHPTSLCFCWDPDTMWRARLKSYITDLVAVVVAAAALAEEEAAAAAQDPGCLGSDPSKSSY